MEKMLFLYNPNSGKGHIKSSLGEITDIFTNGGYDVIVYPSKCKGDIKNTIIKDGKNYDTIVVSGGDGTLNEAIGALMQIEKDLRPKLGYIPSGTTNDFAQSNNIPKNNFKKAAKNIVEGNVSFIDAGKFNDIYFSYVAAFGAFTSVSYATNQQAKNMFGFGAYVVEAIKSLPNIKPHKVKVICDDAEIDDEFIFGGVSSSFYVAGVKLKKELQVSLSDGLFECLLIKKTANIIDFQITIADMLTNNIKSDKFVIMKGKKIKFIFENEVEWTVDGEYGGKVKEAEITNYNRAIKIITK